MSRRIPSHPDSGRRPAAAYGRASGHARAAAHGCASGHARAVAYGGARKPASGRAFGSAVVSARGLVPFLALALILALGAAATPALCAQDQAPATLTLSPELFAGERTEVSGTLSARMSMRKVPYAQVLAEKALVLPKPVERDGARLWPLAQALGGVDPRAFGEVRLDTLGSPRSGQDVLGLVATLGGPDGKTVFASDPLEPVRELTPAWADGQQADHVEVAGADWAPKSLRYQLSRFLDRAPDATWRYAQDGLSTFVQRRFRKQLVGVGAVDVVLARGQSVQVNLVVAPDPARPRRTVVLDWYALNKRVFDLSDGRRVLRLYVGRHLAGLYPGAKSILLKEIALMFFKKDQAAVLADRGVERIIFAPSGLPPELLVESGLPRFLPARARELFTGRNELTVSLAPLSRPPFGAMAVTGLEAVRPDQGGATSEAVTARPVPGQPASGAAVVRGGSAGTASEPVSGPSPALAGQGEKAPAVAVRAGQNHAPASTAPARLVSDAAPGAQVSAPLSTLEAVSLVRTAPRREVPALLAATEERCRTLGVTCDVLDENGLVSQRPVWSLSFAGLAGKAASGSGAPPVYTVGLMGCDGKDQYSCSRRGVPNLYAEGGAPDLRQAPDGLDVRAQGNVTLDFGGDFPLDPGQRYSLWLELGPNAQDLTGVEVGALYPWGGWSPVPVKPGFPAELTRLSGGAEGVRVRFLTHGKDLRFTLRRVRLQRAADATARSGLFSATYLFDQTRPLTVTAQDDRNAILTVPGGPFCAQWLRLHASTKPWTVNDQPPVLRVGVSGATTNTPLPAPESDVVLFLPATLAPDLARCLSGESADTPSRFSVSLTGGAEGATLTVTDARISGELSATWPRMLEQDPLLTLAGRPYLLANLSADQAKAMAERNTWLPLGPARLTPGDDVARFARNPWLEVEALMLTGADGPKLEALGRELPVPPAKAGKGAMLFRLAGAAVLLVLCWLAGRRGRAGSVLGWTGRHLADWLSRERAASGDPLAWKGWVLAGLGLAVAAVFLGPGAGRGALFAGSLLSMPLWRAARARLANGLFGRGKAFAGALTREAWRFHLAGFVLFAGLGALIRLTGAPVIPELFGLGGLWLLLAALLLHLRQPSGADA